MCAHPLLHPQPSTAHGQDTERSSSTKTWLPAHETALTMFRGSFGQAATSCLRRRAHGSHTISGQISNPILLEMQGSTQHTLPHVCHKLSVSNPLHTRLSTLPIVQERYQKRNCARLPNCQLDNAQYFRHRITGCRQIRQQPILMEPKLHGCSAANCICSPLQRSV